MPDLTDCICARTILYYYSTGENNILLLIWSHSNFYFDRKKLFIQIDQSMAVVPHDSDPPIVYI